MQWSFTLGKIFGTNFRIHVTFLFLLLFIFIAGWSQGTLADALRAVLFICAVFACVLIHELGHSLIARRFGTEQQPPQEHMMKMPMMGTEMGKMMESCMKGMFDVMANPETAEKLATFTKNYYDALVKKGFSKTEALEIITSVGMPMPAMLRFRSSSRLSRRDFASAFLHSETNETS